MKRMTVYSTKQEGGEPPLFKSSWEHTSQIFHPRTAGETEESERYDVLSSLTHISTYKHNLLLFLLSFHSIPWGHFLFFCFFFILLFFFNNSPRDRGRREGRGGEARHQPHNPWGHFLVCKHTYILDLLMWF